jgi:tetratricopeptide (TPR) repeat protein
MCPSRFLPVSIGVCLLVLSTAVAARAQSEAEIAYGEAKTAFEAGQFDKARDLLVTASQTDVKSPDIYLLLGKAEYQLGNIEEAMEAWRRTLRLAPAQAYASRMLEVLTGQAVDADARLRIAAGLLQDGLLQPAANELARVRSEKTLSDEQRVELLLLEAEHHVLSSQANGALEELRQLTVRFPDHTKNLRTRLLSARAQVGSGGDLVPAGLAELKTLVAEHADTPEAAAAEVELILHDLIANPEALPPLVAWIKAHADHGSAGAARRRLVEAIGKLLSMADPAAPIGPKVELSETDKLALSTAAATYKRLQHGLVFSLRYDSL